jgi:hypothetical protein
MTKKSDEEFVFGGKGLDVEFCVFCQAVRVRVHLMNHDHAYLIIIIIQIQSPCLMYIAGLIAFSIESEYVIAILAPNHMSIFFHFNRPAVIILGAGLTKPV